MTNIIQGDGVNMFQEYKGKQVTIMCCSDCNAKCKHCYISYKGNFTGEELYNTASTLQQRGYEVLLNGTEPLIHREYLKTYKLLGQWGALTNGLIFHNNFNYLDVIQTYGIKQLSISYHFDMQNQISPVSKQYLMKLWKEILARGMKFKINCTLSTSNMHKIHQYCREALSYGAYKIRFTNLLNLGAANNLDNGLFLNDSDINYVIENINSARELFNKDELYIERCGSFGPIKTKKFHCPAGINSVYLTPDFKVYPCLFLSKPGYSIGFYKDGKLYIHNGYCNRGNCCLALNAQNNRCPKDNSSPFENKLKF